MDCQPMALVPSVLIRGGQHVLWVWRVLQQPPIKQPVTVVLADIPLPKQFKVLVGLGGRVVRVLDSGQLHQSERFWVRFLDGTLKKNCQTSRQSRGHVSSWWTTKNMID